MKRIKCGVLIFMFGVIYAACDAGNDPIINNNEIPGNNGGSPSKPNALDEDERKWREIAVSEEGGIVPCLDWIRENGVSGANYTITVAADNLPVLLAPQTLDAGKTARLSGVSITLKGEDGARILLSGEGALFTVRGAGENTRVTFVLDHVILEGSGSNTDALIDSSYCATLIMHNGAGITGNENLFGPGAVNADKFIMRDGFISDNTGNGSGGGVNAVTVVMSGGIISNNTAEGEYGNGGGICTETMTMSGGTITKNRAQGDGIKDGGDGGGVFAASFSMSNGTISDNTAAAYGGGVCVNKMFKMGSGVISGNTAGKNGGGVRSDDQAQLTGGTISGNKADGSGGGISANTTLMADGTVIEENTAVTGNGGGISTGTVTVQGGEIAENRAGKNGGGIYASKNGTMTKGVITKNTAAGTAPAGEDTANNGSGGGVYISATFKMLGGEISQNEAEKNGGGIFSSSCEIGGSAVPVIKGNKAAVYGGGVYANNLNMLTGIIDDNRAEESGGGVVAVEFTLQGDSKITGNTAKKHAGGIDGAAMYSQNPQQFISGTFKMSGGVISGNEAEEEEGGGVYTLGKFIMEAGEISGNSAKKGGGVFHLNREPEKTTFTKTGGVIYGNNEDPDKVNIVTEDGVAGTAVYMPLPSDNKKTRTNTAGTGDTLDSTKDGVEGGWDV